MDEILDLMEYLRVFLPYLGMRERTLKDTKCLRETVLGQCHDSVIGGGHFGIRKNLEKVRQKYCWAGPMQITGAGYPMEIIATDILGPLPESENGNRYILVINDYVMG